MELHEISLIVLMFAYACARMNTERNLHNDFDGPVFRRPEPDGHRTVWGHRHSLDLRYGKFYTRSKYTTWYEIE